MGDMKTPDFDDLLAAFNIPDMVDPKAAIESGHQDDHDGQHKQPNFGEATGDTHDTTVSVIVKNIQNIVATRLCGVATEKDRFSNSFPKYAVCNELQNGCFQTVQHVTPSANNGQKTIRKDSLNVNNLLSPFIQLSPVSCAGEVDEDEKNENDDTTDRQGRQTFVSPAAKTEDKTSKPSVKNIISRCKINRDKKPQQSVTISEFNNQSPTQFLEDNVDKTLLNFQHKKCDEESPTPAATSCSEIKIKNPTKLPSCTAPTAALCAKKTSPIEVGALHCPETQKKTVPAEESPVQMLQEPSLVYEFTKDLLIGEPVSPSGFLSETSSKGSPASSTDTTPVIPKVRIKTIKTSSGQIKRTVTRVLPELNSEDLKKGENSSCDITTSNLSLSTLLPKRPSLAKTVIANSGGPPIEITKQMTIKPVATAFLPVSAVKTAGSQVINLKLANNTTVKATVIPAASVQSASSAILKAASAIQQQAVMLPTSSTANGKHVPKTVHLSNLNLLSHTMSSVTCDLQQVLSSSKPQQLQQPQQVKQQTGFTGQASKKVSRVQLCNSSQNSVVDSFNKVLSSINPVPVYIPNLSPPTSACISLPTRGYKCLECGDSFALEKSLTQHHERRSVRIEVSCNHCAKSLVFYNKCSLLSHARGHRDKGVVMQCSHLILKPIPADQMITTASSSTGTHSSSQAQTAQIQFAGANQTAVISAPCTSPVVAAMPLEDHASKLGRHNLKCLECNEMFQDDSSLAMHYQQASESSSQETCTICQMLLPNQCSFLSHQRIHQHKSPYICPECGASCRSVHFQAHVTKNCLHYTRRVGYRCLHCSLIFAEVATLKSHIQSTHCEIFYKCPLCPMAFKSVPGTNSHTSVQHPGVKPGEPKVIYKCSMCDTVFTLEPLLYTHFDQHVLNHKVCVFKCPDCSTHYAQKQLLLDHIKAIHGTLKTTEGPPNLGINLPLSTKPTNTNSTCSNIPHRASNRDGRRTHSQGKREKTPTPPPLKSTSKKSSGDFKRPLSSGYSCGECSSTFTSRELFVSHMRREHGKVLKKYPCRECDKSFSSSHSLCRHNRLKHRGLRKVYTCPHCPALSQTFPNRVLLDQHVQMMHAGKPLSGKIDKADASPDRQTFQLSKSQSPKRKLDEGLGSPSIVSRVSGSQPLKRLKVNIPKVNKCAVCGFATEDIAAFHKHIPQHKSGGSSDQCQECGLCYTSHRSLARHLFIVHRLKEGLGRRGREDTESQRENQLGVKDENDNGTPNTKCKVCGKTFETEGQLNTHMRTHGMAFIKSQALNSTEK